MLEPQTAFGCLGKISKVWHFLKADFGVEISFPPPQNPRSRDTAQRHPAPAAKAASPRWGGLQGWETNPSTAVPWGCSSKTPSLCTAQPGAQWGRTGRCSLRPAGQENPPHPHGSAAPSGIHAWGRPGAHPRGALPCSACTAPF